MATVAGDGIDKLCRRIESADAAGILDSLTSLTQVDRCEVLMRLYRRGRMTPETLAHVERVFSEIEGEWELKRWRANAGVS